MSIQYIQLENGETVEVYEYRNEEIKSNLESILHDFLVEQAKDKSGRKRFGFRFLQQIEEELNKSPRMTAEEFTSLTADDIDYIWRKFHSLISYYNRYFEIVPNQETFWLFARINSRQYKHLKEHQDEDIRSVIISIEDRLIGKGWSAGESGNANDKAIKTRLSASGEHGHGIVSASEDKIVNALTQKTPLELNRELQAIINSGGTKRIK